MTDAQHMDEITVPVIEITAGWAAEAINSLDECEDAYSYLMAAIAEIEFEIECYELGVRKFADPIWPARAKRALKYKRAALQLVNNRRSQLSTKQKRELQKSEDKAFLAYIKGTLGERKFQSLMDAFSISEPGQ